MTKRELQDKIDAAEYAVRLAGIDRYNALMREHHSVPTEESALVLSGSVSTEALVEPLNRLLRDVRSGSKAAAAQVIVRLQCGRVLSAAEQAILDAALAVLRGAE